MSKKKILFSVMALVAGLFFMPVVNAKEAPTMEDNLFFANGTAVTIEARDDGVAGAKITWEGGEKIVDANTVVFGGSHESEERIASTSVTMNGGEVRGVFGGGLHKSNVGSAKVTINAGKLNFVQGGGASSFSGTTCHRPWYSGDAKNSPNRVDEAEVVVVNGTGTGSYPIVYGGGEGISYVGTTDVKVQGGNWDYVIAGGSNGYTGVSNLTITGGVIGIVQSVNRGSMDEANISISGGTITNAYVGGDASDAGVTGTIAAANMEITGGTVTNAYVGTNGGQRVSAKDVATLVYNKDAVQNVDKTQFEADSVVATVKLTISAEGETEVIDIPVGSKLTQDEIDALVAELNAELEGTGFSFDGFYKDEKFEEKFDWTQEINDDVVVYVKLVQLREDQDNNENENITNPETSDIGLVGIITTIVIAGAGLGYTIKKRRFN